MAASATAIPEIVAKYESELLEEWIAAQLAASSLRRDLMRDEDLRDQSRRFLQLFGASLRETGALDASSAAWDPVRGFLDQVSRSRARQGFSASETAMFVFSLKQPLFERLRAVGRDPQAVAEETWRASALLDQLGLFTTEVHQKGREDVIARQQQEMLELSTPVVQLWDGIVALPLIGTLDLSLIHI